jgi:Na+-transporting NADH:ubiquinone oxidoreductase subunit A
MNNHIGIRTKRGANIRIKGQAEKILATSPITETFALYPDDFLHLIPKLLLREGDTVKKGTPIFYSKANPDIQIVSPIGGTLESIVRGAKRKIEKIIIKASPNQESVVYTFGELEAMSVEEIKKVLLKSGAWPFLKQRPYGIVADPTCIPKALYVSTIDTAPLQVDFEFLLKNKSKAFQTGINVLAKLIGKSINLGISPLEADKYKAFENVDIYTVEGPHPAGNVSVHIQKISPINPNEKIWVVRPEDVANIGKLFQEKTFSAERVIAIAGNAVEKPHYINSFIGAEVEPLLKRASIKSENVRIINGDVFSGKATKPSGHLSYFNNLVSVIPEGNEYRMFGWLPFVDNSIPSLSKTSFSWLLGKKGYDVNTNLNGEERAIVVTGEMEKLLPMNIYPMQLLKACMAEDIEKMEALGIYEVVPEDFGLIDFANTSKIEAQQIIHEAIRLMINEVG